MKKELLRIVVTQEDNKLPITKIFENGLEVKTYTKFTFSTQFDDFPLINGERIVFEVECDN